MNEESNQNPAGYTACLIAYICYIVAPITMGLLWIAGMIVAIVSLGNAAPEIKEHLNYAKKMGISGLITFIIALVITIVLTISIIGAFIAWLPLLIWWIWSLIKSIRGLVALTRGTNTAV